MPLDMMHTPHLSRIQLYWMIESMRISAFLNQFSAFFVCTHSLFRFTINFKLASIVKKFSIVSHDIGKPNDNNLYEHQRKLCYKQHSRNSTSVPYECKQWILIVWNIIRKNVSTGNSFCTFTIFSRLTVFHNIRMNVRMNVQMNVRKWETMGQKW